MIMTADQTGMFVGILGVMLILFFVLIGIAIFVFWLWMLVDAIKNKALSDTERIVWVLVIVLLHALGALVYFLAGRNK
jgi:Phospholipase_D-nuclease N-terminal